MTYNPSIPQPTDNISVSQGDLLTNFTALNTIFGTDHTALNVALYSGNHKKTTLVRQAADPAAVAGAPILYTKQVTYNGPIFRDELFFRLGSGDGGAVVQLTEMNQAINSTVTGSTFMPGGFVVKWGQFSTSGTSHVASFVSAFNTSPLVVVASPFGAVPSFTWAVSTWNSTSLTIVTSASATAAFTYIAIGI